MFTHIEAPARESPLGLSCSSDAVAALLDLIGPVHAQRVLVCGPGALEIMCALNARGAISVISLQAACRMRPEPVDLTVAANVFSIEAAETAILLARRSSAAGRVCLRFTPGERPALVEQVRTCLMRHGFGASEPHWVAGRAVLLSSRVS